MNFLLGGGNVFDSAALHNGNIEADTEFGLHPCTLTGLFSDDSLFAEIILPPDLTMFARIINPANFFGFAGSSFFKKYAGSIMGYVAFEKGLPEKPLLIGYALTQSENNKVALELKKVPETVSILTEAFNFSLNDENKTAYLKFNEGKCTFGNIDAAQASVLSDTLIGKLNDISDKISELSNTLAKSKILVIGTAGVFSPPDILAISKVSVEISELKATFADIKSTAVFNS